MSAMISVGGGVSDFSLRADEEKYPVWDRTAAWTVWVLLDDGTFERVTGLVDPQGNAFPGDVLTANRFGRFNEASGWASNISVVPQWAYVRRVDSTEPRMRIAVNNFAGEGGGGGGTPAGGGGPTFLRFEFEAPWGTGSVQGGVQDIPQRSRIAGPVILRAEPDTAANDVVVNLRKRPTDGVESDLFTFARPTLPAGKNRAVTIEPDVDSVEEGELWPVLTTQPLSSEASITAATVVTHSIFSSEAGVSSSYSIPIPAGAAVGDLILVITSTQAPDLNFPSAFTRHINRASTDGASATPHSRTMVWSAPWNASMGSTIAVSVNPYSPSSGTPITSTPIVASVYIIRNAALTAPIGWQASDTAGNTSGTSITTPGSGGPNGADTDLIFYVASARYNNAVTGWSSSIDLAVNSERVDRMTTRATATNVSQHVYNAVGAGNVKSATDVIAPQVITLSGGTGDGSLISSTAAAFTIRRGAGRPSPTRVVVTVPIEVVPAT